jgi:competence protein ComEC
MIDCSSEFDFEHLVRPFLRAQGVNRVPGLVLSHGDVHHIGAFAEFAAEFSPAAIFAGPHSSRSPADRRARARFGSDHSLWRTVGRADSLAGWEVLHPLRERKFARADDNALVMRTSIAGWRILCLSDLGREGARTLTRGGGNLAADILIAGSPAGSRVSEDLLSLIGPKLIVFDRAAFDRAEPPAASAPILMPEKHGAISLEFGPELCQVRCASGESLTLWRNRLTTSGSPANDE